MSLNFTRLRFYRIKSQYFAAKNQILIFFEEPFGFSICIPQQDALHKVQDWS